MTEVGKRRILVTGGAGFLGYHLSLELLKDPSNQLVLVDNLTRGKRDRDLGTLLARANVTLITGDLTNQETVAQLGRDYDEVYHLASIIGVDNVVKRPHEVLRVNADSTLLLLDWLTRGGGKKILFASTSEVYAWTQRFYPLSIPTPEDVPLALTALLNPRSSYAGSKIFSELAVTQYCTVYSKPFVILRYHNVYGPRMGNDHVIPQLYSRALKGQNPLIVYSANHRRAFCYISDAVRATILAMRAEAACGKTINVGNDLEEIAIFELAQRLLEKAKLRRAIEPRAAVNDPIERRCPDLTLARKFLGYQPQITLSEGLDFTLAWYSRVRGEGHVDAVTVQ